MWEREKSLTVLMMSSATASVWAEQSPGTGDSDDGSKASDFHIEEVCQSMSGKSNQNHPWIVSSSSFIASQQYYKNLTRMTASPWEQKDKASRILGEARPVLLSEVQSFQSQDKAFGLQQKLANYICISITPSIVWKVVRN